MTPERWRQVTELFHAARALDASERQAYLRQADGDEEVLAEVRAMLAAYEKGAPDVPAMTPAPDPMEVEPGSAIGPYEVREMIGAGGMGRVYRARDSRLDRDVALKVLPSHYAADADRLRRFEQEARASGALTHPNLVTVFDVGTDNGRPYLVTELLDGETLRDRLRRGALPLARAADIAAALARGVAAAHARGIVHRDLKPENVMITRDGRVKILDFGVAKLRSDSDIRPRESSRPVQTESGVVIGTAGYMAPEQIRGAEADGRADVFALGAILFELLTGQRAFDGPTRADTFEATLRDDPLSSPATGTWPPAALRIVQRCLEKDPETRFQSAADLAFALETITDGRSIQRADRTHARRLAPVAIGATLLLAVAGGVVQLWQPPVPTDDGDQLVRFAIPIGPRIRYTERPAISRDGTTIVYPASEGLIESRQLYVRRIDQITTVALSGTTGASSTFFSPDGESVAFWSEGALKRTRLDGTTAPVTICPVQTFHGGTWLANGTIVFASENPLLQQVDANGGTPRPFTAFNPAESEFDLHAPEMLPGDRALLVTVHQRKGGFRIDAIALDTGARRTVIDDGFDPRYLSTGHIVYGAGTALFAVPFSLERFERSGPPVQLVGGVFTDQLEGDARYAISDNGTLVFLPLRPPARRTIAWVDQSGTTTPLSIEPRTYWTPRLSPDGNQFAVVVQEQEDADIWIHRFDNGTFSRLTSDGVNLSPVWSRDGSELFYASERDGRWQLMREALDGRSVPEVLLISAQVHIAPASLAADGRSLLLVEGAPTGTAKLRVLDLARREATTLEGLPERVGMPAFSPGGRWLAFTSWDVRPSIFVRPYPNAGPVRELNAAAGYTVWNAAGDKLYFRTRRGATEGSPEDGVFELPFDPVRGIATGPERQLFRKAFTDMLGGVPGFDLSADGRFLLVLSDRQESLPTEPNVLLHVDDEIRRRASQ